MLEACGAGFGDHLLRTARAMLPIEDSKHPQHHRLHPNKHTIEADLTQPTKITKHHHLKINLNSDLDVFGQPEPVDDLPDHQPKMLGRQKNKHTTPEEDRRDQRDAIIQHLTHQTQLTQHSVHVAAATDTQTKLGRRVNVEVAVPTPHLTEKNV